MLLILGGYMKKQQIEKIIKTTVASQTIYQFKQLKSFIDESLKQVASKSFENDAEKIKHLLSTLYNVRDFSLTLTTENSVRNKILSDIKKMEEELELGNELEKQKEKLSQITDEQLEQDQKE